MPNDRTKRLFLALNLPDPVKAQITDYIAAVASNGYGIRWIKPEGLHITLHFLGDTGKGELEKVKMAMQSIESKFNEPIRFTLEKPGAFPNWQRPRVIYLGCLQGNGKSVVALHKITGEHLSRLGFQIDHRPWLPHITLGRLREGDRFDLSGGFHKTPKAEFVIQYFDLMESILRYDGAEYRVLARYNFARPEISAKSFEQSQSE